jgi:hypothetical protein
MQPTHLFIGLLIIGTVLYFIKLRRAKKTKSPVEKLKITDRVNDEKIDELIEQINAEQAKSKK